MSDPGGTHGKQYSLTSFTNDTFKIFPWQYFWKCQEICGKYGLKNAMKRDIFGILLGLGVVSFQFGALVAESQVSNGFCKS